ncbi:MAG: hypothetical protein LBQ40_05860 [Clostridiales bacterium]|jgi:hypothetical protein|nr:hypothetical protein [Clostridiales bacterium]
MKNKKLISIACLIFGFVLLTIAQNSTKFIDDSIITLIFNIVMILSAVLLFNAEKLIFRAGGKKAKDNSDNAVG